MAGLRTLLQLGGAASGSLNYDTLRVWNTNTTTAENGGQCCLWTVPANVNWFAVEMWGGGGGGAGACCCMAGWPGGSGSYARKIITTTAGSQYTICAAGTTNCSNVCVGCASYPSFLRINGGAVQICASGGSLSCSRCSFHIGCSFQGCQQFQCGSFCGTFGICGVTGSAKSQAFCSGNYYQFMPSAPYISSMNRPTKDGCSGYCGGCCSGGFAMFPGGGGASTSSHTTGPFCGAAGAGGLVTIYYPTVVA